ncbi:olfactory receptor [Crotalus adamanteus]|uniref:Olfactory receptor n=1 Tax=Crotalus adamanteus TaxID=8729 RepID=A0AAW1B6M4_CROAD|nr:olfactory receptor [Crotalus adamanteus]
MNGNSSTPTEFVLLGISERTDLQALLFAVFLIFYFFILMGNMLVFVATISSQALHTPMYFFLRHLSFLDICYTSVILPQMLVHFITKRKTISFLGCAMQMFFYIFLGTAMCYLLAVMAYDRYLAICHPLHYMRLMTRRTCFLFVSGCWVIGLFVSLLQTWLIFSLPLCGSNVVNHFFCDISPLMRLNYPSNFINNVENILAVFLVLVTPFIFILVSYILIITAISKLIVPAGRQRALGTCSSHMVSVIFFYGTAMFTYLRPKFEHSDSLGKLLSLIYTMAPAILNPVIYSLRNKPVKDAIKKILAKFCMSMKHYFC